MKVIFDRFHNGFFEFIELPISKDSRKILVDKNKKDMFFQNLQHPFEIEALMKLVYEEDKLDVTI